MTWTPTKDAPPLSCPYPGLRPFRADEAVVFFGRDEQVDQLLERLGRQRFLAVVGTSGCGKSSLVHAGLIPGLKTGLMGSAGARWAVATMRPGDRPLWRLAEALLDKAVLGPAWSDLDHPTAQLHAALQRGPLGLAEVLDETPLPGARKLLLLVDQFEELFRYRREGEGQRDEANAFVSLLLATARETDRPVYIVLTMRSDYLGDCALFDGLPEALNDSQFLTPKLTRAQRQQAIEGPARVFDGRVEPALVTRLLNDMGSGPDQLPLMQHALMRLWKGSTPASDGAVELTLATYEALGSLEGALSGPADAAYESLGPEQQRITEILFRCLCEWTTAGRDIRRPTRLEEVARVAEVTPEAVLAVVDVFRDPDRCFLTPPWPLEIRPDDILDISHESLIRHWGRLRAWVDNEARSAEIYRRLDQTARLWSEGLAALWGPPDLDLALSWKEEARPKAAWAARYGGDFDRAIRFLDASVAERERKLRQVDSIRQLLSLPLSKDARESLEILGLMETLGDEEISQKVSEWVEEISQKVSEWVIERLHDRGEYREIEDLQKDKNHYVAKVMSHAPSAPLEASYRFTTTVDISHVGQIEFKDSTAENYGPWLVSRGRHTLTLPEKFRMGVYPVTNEFFLDFVKDGGYTEECYWADAVSGAREKCLSQDGRTFGPSTWPSGKAHVPGREHHPVAGIGYYEAMAFCNWLQKKHPPSEPGWKWCLPTEDMWEFSARGQPEEGRLYPWGREFRDGYCNSVETGNRTTTDVGTYRDGVSPYGCFDMAGNVWELVVTEDKQRPWSCFLKGGSFRNNRDAVKSSLRLFGVPREHRAPDFGFRCSQVYVVRP